MLIPSVLLLCALALAAGSYAHGRARGERDALEAIRREAAQGPTSTAFLDVVRAATSPRLRVIEGGRE